MTLCHAPFLHRYIDTSGQSHLCCTANPRKSNQNFQEWSGEDYQDIRKHMLTEQELPEMCYECKDLEDVGQNSTRMIYDKMYKNLGSPSLNIEGGTEFYAPISYDLRLNNLCNLACRMCGPSASTQLFKEAIEHPHLWPWWEDEDPSKYNQADISSILEEASSMYDLRLLGGEPTVQPQTKAILKRLIEVGNTNVKIFMTTNGTNVNKEYFDLLKQFKNVIIVVSIDSYGSGQEYIRGGANWNKIWDNVRKIYEEVEWSGHFSLGLNQTVQTYTIFDFWELRQKAYEDYPWIDHIKSSIVYWPTIYSPQHIPTKWKEMAIEIAIKNNSYEAEKHIFDFIMKSDEDMTIMQQLKAFTPLMDFARNRYLQDYFPLCHKLLEEIE